MDKARAAWRLIEAALRTTKNPRAKDRIEEMAVHASGYADSRREGDVIVTGDWNSITKWDEESKQSVEIDGTPGRLARAFEKIGVEIEWSDEWAACDECHRLIRTSPNCWSWQPAFVHDEDGIRCQACVLQAPEAYLESLEGNIHKAVTLDVAPAAHGYVLAAKDYERGFHPGQDASPKLVARALEDQGISRYLFVIDSVGQFDASFSVYVHESEAGLLDKGRLESAPTDGPSVSAAMRRGLEEASARMAALPDGQGVKCAKVGMDGVEVRVVPYGEFVEEGIK